MWGIKFSNYPFGSSCLLCFKLHALFLHYYYYYYYYYYCFLVCVCTIASQSYHVIVLVPDLVDRTFLKELMNVLLLRMEFSSAFLHQESVCATFSAGLSSACVVNVGGEVTHVCCVEEGMSNPNTR